MRVAVFAYNFPHKKTQDFLFRLFLEKIDVGVVLAADPVELRIPGPAVRMKVRGGGGLVHPKSIADRFGWRYEVVEHNSTKTTSLLKDEKIDVAVIAGARILKRPVIEIVPQGIINFHPGLLPEVRGLDAMQWALHEGHPLGVTAHVIDDRVDAGVILLRREIPLYLGDTVFDVSQRLLDIQVDMLPEALGVLASGVKGLSSAGAGTLHRKMPPDLEQMIPDMLQARLAKIAKSSA